MGDSRVKLEDLKTQIEQDSCGSILGEVFFAKPEKEAELEFSSSNNRRTALFEVFYYCLTALSVLLRNPPCLMLLKMKVRRI